MTSETAQSADLQTRLAGLDFASSDARDDAIGIAEEALAAGHDTAVEAICRRVLARDVEHDKALELLQCVLARLGRHAEALVIANEVLQHYRRICLRDSIAYGLHLLHERGFVPQGILDIGAYWGEFSMLARQFFTTAPVVMVEPQPRAQAQLHEIAAPLGGEVHVCEALLGDRRQAACTFYQMDTPFGSTGSSTYPELSSHPRAAVQMPMRTVDDLLAEFPGRHFDLVKIDVQGAELDVLRGAAASLPRIEVVFLELSLHAVNRGAPRMAEVIAFLDTHGFAIWELLPLPRSHDGLHLQTDAVFVRKTSPLWRRETPGTPQ